MAHILQDILFLHSSSGIIIGFQSGNKNARHEKTFMRTTKLFVFCLGQVVSCTINGMYGMQRGIFPARSPYPVQFNQGPFSRTIFHRNANSMKMSFGSHPRYIEAVSAMTFRT